MRQVVISASHFWLHPFNSAADHQIFIAPLMLLACQSSYALGMPALYGIITQIYDVMYPCESSHIVTFCCTTLQATGQQYTITTPPVTGAYYNVRIQLNQSLGHVGFYCNPGWGGQPNQANTVAQLGNSVWQTGLIGKFSDSS